MEISKSWFYKGFGSKSAKSMIGVSEMSKIIDFFVFYRFYKEVLLGANLPRGDDARSKAERDKRPSLHDFLGYETKFVHRNRRLTETVFVKAQNTDSDAELAGWMQSLPRADFGYCP